MSDNCRNDCVKPSRFPKEIFNRPGLERIDYRIGDYADIRQALLHKLNQDPVLAHWTHRQSDDPGIALLEGSSILGDILTFYQELYANEAYLRTAQWRESISDLVRLLGYRLSPGLGGKATFAVEVKGDEPVTIPKGFRFKAQLEGMDKPTEFETTKEAVAHPSLSKFSLFRELFQSEITKDTKEFNIFLADQYHQQIELQEGDRLLIGEPHYTTGEEIPNRFFDEQIVIVDKIRELHGRKLYTIQGRLQHDYGKMELAAYKLGRTFRHFGHNAPKQDITVSADDTVSAVNVDRTRSLTRPTFEFTHPTLKADEFPLDVEVDDLAIGGQMVIESQQYAGDHTQRVLGKLSHVRTIKDIESITMRWGALIGASTRVTLDEAINQEPLHTSELGRISFHEVLSPLLGIRARPIINEEQTEGKKLSFYGTDKNAQNLESRPLLFEEQGEASFINNVVSVESFSSAVSAAPIWAKLYLDQDVKYADFPNEDPLVNVYGNLVEANQGKTENQAVLGSGDSRQVFQTFKLPKKPLTYFRSEEESPPEAPELRIYVNDRLWQRVPSFFGQGPNQKVYIVRQDDEDNSWVQFGARLPSGVDNVTAIYRTGTGASGPMKEGTTARAGQRLEGLRKVHLPGDAFGGSAPESGEDAKAAAPGKVQSLGRLVSLQDIEYEARALSGVVKAAARWDIHVGTAAVVVTLLTKSGPTDIERQELEGILNQANHDRGSRRFPIIVRPGVRHYIYLTVSVGYDATYKKALLEEAAKIALGVTGEEEAGIDGSKGLFGTKYRQFGQPEYATRIEGTIQPVKGVVWSRVESIRFLVDDASNPVEWEQRAPLAANAVIRSDSERDEAPDQVLLTLNSTHLRMEFFQVEPTEVGCHG